MSRILVLRSIKVLRIFVKSIGSPGEFSCSVKHSSYLWDARPTPNKHWVTVLCLRQVYTELEWTCGGLYNIVHRSERRLVLVLGDTAFEEPHVAEKPCYHTATAQSMRLKTSSKRCKLRRVSQWVILHRSWFANSLLHNTQIITVYIFEKYF